MLSDDVRQLVRDLFPKAKWNETTRALWEETLEGIQLETCRTALFSVKRKYPYPQPEIAWVIEFLPVKENKKSTATPIYFVEFEAHSLKYNGRTYPAARKFLDRAAALEFSQAVGGRIRA